MNRFPGGRAAIGLAVLFLSGCNKLRLAYEFSDWLIIYAVNNNFKLEREQKTRFKGDVETYFRWHREEMLPLYADWLSRGADSIRSGFRPEAYDSAHAEFRRLYGKTLEPVVERAHSLLSSLTPEQRKAYAATLRRKNRKLRKEFGYPRERRLEERYRKTISAIEDWAGNLSGDQKKRVKVLSLALPWNGPLWLENREKIHEEMIALLEAGPEADDRLRAFLEDYFLRPEKFRSPEYQRGYREYEILLKVLFMGLNEILTPKQKNRFLREVAAQAWELRDLSQSE